MLVEELVLERGRTFRRGIAVLEVRGGERERYQPKTDAKMSGATMVASDSIRNIGVSSSSLPHVIFSVGNAPE
jgi:hypothetical protein